jgi:hypothetical protein
VHKYKSINIYFLKKKVYKSKDSGADKKKRSN